MDTIPGIADLRRTIIELMAKRSIEIIKNPHLSAQAVDELEERISGLKEKKGSSLSGTVFLPITFPCITAAPNVRILDIEGTLSGKMLLSYSKILERTYQLSDINDLERENFDTFDPEVFPDVPVEGSRLTQREYMVQLKNRLMDYVGKFPNNKRKTILFSGKTGLGKTFLLNCMAKTILDMGYTVMRISAYKLFNQLFLSALQDNEENLFLFNCLFDVDTLIIDDLGTETQRNNFTNEDLFNILNERFTQGKHTFYQANLGLTEIKERYSIALHPGSSIPNTMLIRLPGRISGYGPGTKIKGSISYPDGSFHN